MEIQHYTRFDLNEQLLAVLELCAFYAQLLIIISALMVVGILGLLILRVLAEGKLPIEDATSFAEELEQEQTSSQHAEAEHEYSDESSLIKDSHALLKGLIYN